jgi:membrane-associated phospholipid phosphatase
MLGMPVEEWLTLFARWLGSNALVFFMFATTVACGTAWLVWYLLVHHAPRLGRWSAEWTARLTRHRGVAWFTRPFSRWSWLAAYLTVYGLVAFVTAAVGLLALIELADEVASGEHIAAFDEAFTASLRASTAHATLVLFRFATRLGDPTFLIGLGSAVALVLIWKRRRLTAAVWIAATAGNGLLTWLLKSIFERTRPIHEHGLLVSEGWSFPSGHASGSFAVYTMLLYVLMRNRELRWWHLPLVVLAMGLTLAIGFSRVFLQVHYLSDVLAGYLVAGTWLCLCITAAEAARAAARRR